MQTIDQLKGLVGRIVLFKARNIKGAEWEMGMLDSVEQLVGWNRVNVILKGRRHHSFDARDFEVKPRA